MEEEKSIKLLEIQEQDRKILDLYFDTARTQQQKDQCKEADRAFWAYKINSEIALHSGFNTLDTNQISDGYHTFGELYEHRYLLFFALAKSEHETWISCVRRGVDKYEGSVNPFWATYTHSDGSKSYDGYFLAGLGREKGKQITYHIPIQYWDMFIQYADLLDRAPEFDGHTSADVLERLKSL